MTEDNKRPFRTVYDIAKGRTLIIHLSDDELEERRVRAAEMKPLEIRGIRDGLLRDHVDSIGAIRWDAMPPGEKAQWRAYRQALLDIPQSAGFPHDIWWPTPPGDVT